jgi:predicted RNA-binding Zn-ribbon protein involved in translation (DUF1610 family)/lipopolysaccharide export LptBFGC system permease protein LptF
MSNALRLSEKWFKRGLWLVAFVFAGFLIGLGGAIVDDLPKVETRHKLEDFMDRAENERLKSSVERSQLAAKDAQVLLQQAQLRHNVAQSDARSSRETFSNWLATRRATGRAEQDTELVERTAQLDRLAKAEREALADIQTQQKASLDANQSAAKAQEELRRLQDGARETLRSAERSQELRVFLYRLLLTLPLLALALWLFLKKRQGPYWPFVWGFILFAVFTFFFELVPYLPSYGGYVRYTVGIVLTVLIGRQAIVALNRYLEQQKKAEALPDAKRRQDLAYDVALARLAKGVCPGCERKVDLKDEKVDFCPHCGIGLFDRCGACQARKSAFSPFCHACGAQAGTKAPAAPAPA